MKTRSQTKSGQLYALEEEAVQKLSMLSDLKPKRAIVKAPKKRTSKKKSPRSPSRLSPRNLAAASVLASMSSKRKY
jgi:hypothetical protein